MMRLAKETLRTNRLLFIRQPNHANAVLYHIYARILESLAEKVLGGDRTQLELLLANSFVKILNVEASQKSKDIVTALQNNSLSLFARLGTEGSQKNADNWEYIERKINLWWTSQYSAAGDAAKLIKGIIKLKPSVSTTVRMRSAGKNLPWKRSLFSVNSPRSMNP
jgi:hypothetical protein